ncbi:nicotinamide N-methyltransferase [Trichonephila clavipes]|nr:nicotinamide N-methyltransferase [Trichonephila clavipes]
MSRRKQRSIRVRQRKHSGLPRYCGLSFRKIGSRVGRNQKTVMRICNRWMQEGTTDRRGRSHPPQCTTSLSARNIRRRLQQSGLSARRPLLGLPLTQTHRRLHSQWCDERRMWVAERNEVVFADASHICLQHHDGRIRVWRHRGERMLNSCVMHRHTGPAPDIMVWGGIGYHSRTPLVHITGTLNSQHYISKMLEPFVLPYLQGLATAIFQRDNARPHVARIVQRFFVNHQIELLPWSSRSPDLSPMENMWSMVAQQLSQITPHLPHQINFGNVWKLLLVCCTPRTHPNEGNSEDVVLPDEVEVFVGSEDEELRPKVARMCPSQHNKTTDKNLLLFPCICTSNYKRFKGKKLLEIGSGATVHNIACASAYFPVIVQSDFVKDNRETLKRWLKEDSPLDWSEFLNIPARMEDFQSDVNEVRAKLESRIRRSVKAVVQCDILTDGVLSFDEIPAEATPPYDLIIAISCVEVPCADFESFVNALKRINKLLRKGGGIIMSSFNENSTWNVGKNIFPNLSVTLKEILSAMDLAGFGNHDAKSYSPIHNTCALFEYSSFYCLASEKL